MKKVSQRKRQWLHMIHANKLTCPVTDLKVAYCSYDRTDMGTFHYNFYSENGKLFTVDHIIPRSKGGSKMKLKNLQPMIGKYNWRKGSIDNKEYLARHGK
jgi:5-methylcytosine-specific restriction endonuclease McrA